MDNIDYRLPENLCREAEQLKNAVVLITGANGLIGSFTCRALDALNAEKDWNIRILVMVRDAAKGNAVLEKLRRPDLAELVLGDVTQPVNYSGDIDYIIHTACPTAGKFFSEHPVETIATIVDGTKNMLYTARDRHARSMVYASSMEVYGQVTEEILLTEDKLGPLDLTNLRNSYPMGKRMAEQLCLAAAREYGVSAKSIRLSQTFGPGVSPTENRVFAQFLRSCLKHEDIVMHTEGRSKRMYLDTRDAVNAILTVLLKGEAGGVYNAGNPATYSSIREMAEFVSALKGGTSRVVIQAERNVGQYPPDNMLMLDVSRLQALGWQPGYGMKEMYLALENELEV